MRRSRVCVARKSSTSHWMVMMLGLLALAVQSFVVQTHIHIPQAAGRSQSVSLITLAAAAVTDRIVAVSTGAVSDSSSSAVPRDKYPINEDPSNCPLCQEISHSGQFVQSAALVAALPFSINVHFIVFDEALPSFFAVSHIWQGRAPPSRSTNS